MLKTFEEMMHEACLRHLHEKAVEVVCKHRDKRQCLLEPTEKALATAPGASATAPSP